MTYVLRTLRDKTILRTPSIRRLQTEIGYRFGEAVRLRSTYFGYDVIRVERERREERRTLIARVERRWSDDCTAKGQTTIAKKGGTRC